MDNGLYVALSRQMILRRQMDVTANNIANANTAGFKVENLIVRTNQRTVGGPASGQKLNFALDGGLARDFAQGALERTEGTYDLGLDGDGFFKVQTERGERYTRDGRFGIDPQGQLVTHKGEAVLGASGQPIILDPSKDVPKIATDGTITQGATPKGKIGVFRFDDRATLEKDGDSQFRNISNIQPAAAPEVQVRQGAVEASNVQSVLEVTNLIEISRAYERIAKMMDQSNDLDRRAIERLGRMS